MTFLVSRLLIKIGFETILYTANNEKKSLHSSESSYSQSELCENTFDYNAKDDSYSSVEKNEEVKIKQSDYNLIYDLIGHFNKRNENIQFLQIHTAVELIVALAKTDFIPSNHKNICNHNISENDKSCCTECLITIICSTIRHLEQIYSNGFSLTRMKCCKAKDGKITWNKKVLGAGIFKSLSMFNHSCDPNIYPFFYHDKAVVRTIHPIKAGEELCTSYAEYFASCSKPERASRLVEHYCFICNCPACEFNWPQIDIPQSLTQEQTLSETVFKCTHCRKAISSYSCNRCGMSFDLENAKQNLINILDDCNRIGGRPMSKFLHLMNNHGMTELEELVEKPNILFSMCQALLLDYLKAEVITFMKQEQKYNLISWIQEVSPRSL